MADVRSRNGNAQLSEMTAPDDNSGLSPSPERWKPCPLVTDTNRMTRALLP